MDVFFGKPLYCLRHIIEINFKYDPNSEATSTDYFACPSDSFSLSVYLSSPYFFTYIKRLNIVTGVEMARPFHSAKCPAFRLNSCR